MDDQKTMVVSVHAKDCVDYQCRRCGQCCRHIKDAVMVESMTPTGWQTICVAVIPTSAP